MQPVFPQSSVVYLIHWRSDNLVYGVWGVTYGFLIWKLRHQLLHRCLFLRGKLHNDFLRPDNFRRGRRCTAPASTTVSASRQPGWKRYEHLQFDRREIANRRRPDSRAAPACAEQSQGNTRLIAPVQRGDASNKFLIHIFSGTAIVRTAKRCGVAAGMVR